MASCKSLASLDRTCARIADPERSSRGPCVDTDLETITLLEQLQTTPAIWERLAQADGASLAVQSALREEFSPEIVRAGLTLTDLRKQAQSKFTRAEQMWFDRVRLEQATHELVARHKASRFASVGEARVLDLCSGIGADAIAIAGHALVEAVDASPLAGWYLARNAEVYGVAHRITTRTSQAEAVNVADRFVHLDPDRRSNGQRQVRLESGSPGLPFLQQLTTTASGGAIKVSPASNFGGKFPGCEVELISLNGECKEATIWFGSLRRPEPFRVTVLPEGASIAGDPWDYRPRIRPLGRYLYDPDPAVVRAGLVDLVAETLGLGRLDDAEEYLTGDELVVSPFVRGFEVLADLPNNTRDIRDWFRTSPFGQVEIKCRHIRIEAEEVRRKLPLPGSEPGVLLFARVGGKARAIAARRV